MKRISILFCGLLLTFQSMSAERLLENSAAASVVPGANMLRYKDFSSIPVFIRFQEGHYLDLQMWQDWMKVRYFKADPTAAFKLIGTETDKLGMTHYRYQQMSKGYGLENGTWILHTINNKIVSMNGELFDRVPALNPTISESAALQIALAQIGATTYKWQMSEEESNLKFMTSNPDASYYPQGELVILNEDQSMKTVNLKLSWKFNVYAHEPLSRREIYIDAASGTNLFENDLIHHADSIGVATTGYLGVQNIVANYTGTNFTLSETGRGDGILTFDMNNGTNYGAATLFTDDNNIWNSGGINAFGLDAHFGSEMTYDFYYNHFNRNSIDNSGFALYSYVHYNVNYGNAFWDGQRMTYGDGSNGNSPFTAIDITGHEITHGLTNFTADLVYSYESGALNESFSDIFGAAVEFDALGFSNGDWLMGEDLGFVIRSMNNPGLYGDPDTYGAGNWFTGAGDNGGVHINSGVQNYWYYLLTMGGSGTNDLGNSYNVTGIGIDDASAIAFRNLTVYLTTNSQYADARFYAIQSAIDLFGACTQEVSSTGTAWYAVGVGSPYSTTVNADFTASQTSSCSLPFTANFTDQSSNATSYLWNFGDGSTSTQTNPSHTYTQAGNYNVTLQVSSSCGSDSLISASFIQVGPEVPCDVSLAESGQVQTQKGCFGYLYDNGGATGSYLPNSDSYIIISPCAADNITISFDEFNLEAGLDGQGVPYDYLDVHDGNSLGATLIGRYYGSTSSGGNPPPATITSSGGSLTIRMVADGGLEYSGFKISWECQQGSALPVAAFESPKTESCTPVISFTDLSENCPDQWLWNFGDGNTSNDQNPTHLYNGAGSFNVQLIATNASGSDTITMSNYITLILPDEPIGNDVQICPGDSAYLVVSSSGGENRWYDAPFATIPIYVGDTLLTPNLTQSTAYYVEHVESTLDNVGPADNTIGNGGSLNFNQYLIFDVAESVRLKTVTVYATGAGDREIELRDQSGTILQSIIVAMADGQQDVTLNFDIEPGIDYQLGLAPTSLAAMYRNNTGTAYPYTSQNGEVSITRSSANQNPTGFYYFFYNWKIEQYCASSRLQIAASTGECTGIEELNEESVRIFPNPTSGAFSLESDVKIDQVRILNAQGQLVQEHNLNKSEAANMNVTLASGVYFVHIKSVNATMVRRVVVQ